MCCHWTQIFLFINYTYGKAGQVVVLNRHKAGVLCGFTANERRAGLNTALGNAGNDCRDFLGIILSASDVIKEEEGLCANTDYIVYAHSNGVNSDSVVLIHKDCKLNLGAAAVGAYSGFDPNSSESYIIFELNQDKHLEQSIQFASIVQNEFIKTAQRKDRGVRQAGFLVLAATSMPGVLVELDFICNPTQEKFLNSSAGQKKLAKAIFNAVNTYKQKIDRFTDNNNTTDTLKQASSTNIKEYKIQILSSNRILKQNDKQFLGLAPISHYIDNDIYKYTYGNTQSWNEAIKLLNEVKTKFPEAFIITTINGKRIK